MVLVYTWNALFDIDMFTLYMYMYMKVLAGFCPKLFRGGKMDTDRRTYNIFQSIKMHSSSSIVK